MNNFLHITYAAKNNKRLFVRLKFSTPKTT